tara:strand:+ start:400 stop:600 length:201 start_codon:yes stop_codon:yes gene_type:complete
MKIQKYKMDKKTFDLYVQQEILSELSKAKWGKNRSAIITAKAKGTRKNEFFPVEVEVLGYYKLPIY